MAGIPACDFYLLCRGGFLHDDMQCQTCHQTADDPQRDYPPLCRECGENKIRMALRKREPIPIENYRSEVIGEGLTKWERYGKRNKVLAE